MISEDFPNSMFLGIELINFDRFVSLTRFDQLNFTSICGGDLDG